MADSLTSARARARLAMTADIKDAARRHLAEHGAAGLSLRAVARDLGVVSSAVYRYVASRDELLTLLIVDAYDALGAEVERCVAGDGDAAFIDRWTAVGRTVRSWSLASPHEHALVFGSPVPGYEAPQATVPAAMRAPRAALSVVADGVASGEVSRPSARLPATVRSELAAIAQELDVRVPPPVLARALQEWTWLIGHLGYELFGHLEGGIFDRDGFFEVQLARSARNLAAG